MGHTVVGCGRDQERLGALREQLGPPHRFDVVDVLSDEGVAIWAEAVAALPGVPDLLINNAGVINRRAPLWELTSDEFDRVIDVNVKGVVNVVRHSRRR